MDWFITYTNHEFVLDPDKILSDIVAAVHFADKETSQLEEAIDTGTNLYMPTPSHFTAMFPKDLQAQLPVL